MLVLLNEIILMQCIVSEQHKGNVSNIRFILNPYSLQFQLSAKIYPLVLSMVVE